MKYNLPLWVLIAFIVFVIIFYIWKPSFVQTWDSTPENKKADFFKVVVLSFVLAYIINWIIQAFVFNKVENAVEAGLNGITAQVNQLKTTLEGVITATENQINIARKTVENTASGLQRALSNPNNAVRQTITRALNAI